MAKTILPVGSYTYNPGSQQVDFTNFTSATGEVFNFSRLYAIIDVTYGQIIYSTAGNASGLGGSYSSPILILQYNTTAFTSTELQIIYDLANAPSATYDGTGTQPILSSTDPITGREGLDINLLNSSFGGQLTYPLPSYTTSGYNAALSMGFINGGNLVAPAMDPMTNELIVQSSGVPLQNVNLTNVNGSSISLGQNFMANSLPVVIAVDQPAIPITSSTPINVNVTQSASQDVLGVAIGGNRNNQIEISFNSAPGASLVTNTFTGTGSATVSSGHTIYAVGTTPSSSAKGVSVQTTTYRPAHEIYSVFTAAFLNNTINANSRIGLFDTNNGFYLGFKGNDFGVTVRNNTSDNFTIQSSFNTDTLLGASTSKFTRNGVPEAVNFAYSNLFRIRFAWLGSANIYFEIFSPDGQWVLFHNIRQPNTSYNPSIQSPNLPMTVEIVKTAGSNNTSIATACWGAGTTSAYSPITDTLNDKSLAALTRSVITGVTTGGGGGYVNVKVNPSGALVTDSTISGTPSVNLAQLNGTTISTTNRVPVQAYDSSGNPILTLGGFYSQLATESEVLINGGVPATGNGTSTAQTQRVILASDQVYQDLIVNGGALSSANANLLFSSFTTGGYEIQGYRSFTAQINGSAGIVSGGIIFEQSNDNTNWINFQTVIANSATPVQVNGTIPISASTSQTYYGPLFMRYIRIRIINAFSGGTVNAYCKFLQSPFTQTVLAVANTTPSNLQVQVSGSLTSAGTVSTVSAVTTVSTITAANLATNLAIDIASTAITTSQTSANIATLNTQSATFAVFVTAISGSGAAMDVQVQETMNGTDYYTIYTFERITATGQYYSPLIKLSGSGLRYIRTVSGSSPSITNSVSRNSRSGQAETVRRFIDRTIDPNTLNSTTGAFFCDGVEDFNLIVRCTAQTTPATIALEFSQDNTNWFTSSFTVSTVAGITQAKATNEQWKFVRAKVTSAGSGITLGETVIGGHSA